MNSRFRKSFRHYLTSVICGPHPGRKQLFAWSDVFFMGRDISKMGTSVGQSIYCNFHVNQLRVLTDKFSASKFDYAGCGNDEDPNTNLLATERLVEEIAELSWKWSLNLRQDEVVGLDVGSSAVKIVGLRRDNGRYGVTAAGMVEIEPDGDDDHRAELNAAKAISRCFESAGIQSKLAVCSVCGPEVAVRDFKFPSLAAEEIEGAVMLEAGQVCPFDTAHGSIDYQVMSDSDNCIRGMLVAATNKVIRRKVQLAKKASVDCVLMDVDGLALLNCLNEYEQRQPGCAAAVLNVGRSYTTLAAMGDNGLPFIRDIACAGDHIAKKIAAQTGQPIETVTAILFGKQAAEFDLQGSLEKACERLIVDVNETLRFYAAQEKLSIAEKIYICGGFALVREFVEVLNRRLAVKAVLWNPFDRMSGGGWHCRDATQKDLLQKNGPAMAVAAGLAMRSV